MGDFNALTQEEDENGKIIMDLISQHNLVLLNSDDNCKGTMTWSQGDRSSAVDLIIISSNM